jgi:predicted  nucleic acid-binding Zn-ribbon protein
MTLMQHLPPGGWTQVATKSHLDALEQRIGHRSNALEQRMDRLEDRMDRLEDRMEQLGDRLERLGDRLGGQMERLQGRMDGFHQELRTQTRVFIFAMLGAMATNTSIIVAAIRLS